MRITYRSSSNENYWEKRWRDIPVDQPMENSNKYPLRYANLVIGEDQSGRILEAGCGAGRILRYYKNRGYRIVGIDFIEPVIQKLKESDPELDVETANILNLRFKDHYFKYVLAFGLYHNLENHLEQAIQETYRVLEPGGWVCASFRADNIQTRLVDWLADKNDSNNPSSRRYFHKVNLTKFEFISLFENAGFRVRDIYPVENMPVFYKFPFFRAKNHKTFSESLARKEGYKLSLLGKMLQGLAVRCFPHQFCNIYVLIAQKPKDSDG